MRIIRMGGWFRMLGFWIGLGSIMRGLGFRGMIIIKKRLVCWLSLLRIIG